VTEQREICIVDDDADVRESLEMLLRRSGYRVKVFGSAHAFLEAGPGPDCSCVLADVRMPEMDGLALQREINRRWPALPVVIMTGHGDIQMAVQAMRAGAVDFLEKPFEKQALIEAIARAQRPSRAEALSRQPSQSVTDLTDREREVFELLVEGHQNKMIAHRMGISVRTVEVHRARVMAKLRVHNLPELVKLALGRDTK